MEVKINLANYLDDDEIKQIAIDTVSSIFNQQLRGKIDVKNFISDICYRSFFAKLCEVMNLKIDDINNMITKELKELLEDESTYRFLVFSREGFPFFQDTKPSPATKILDEVLSQSRPLIEKKVNEFIDKYPFKELKEEICLTIYDCIERKLFKTNSQEV